MNVYTHTHKTPLQGNVTQQEHLYTQGQGQNWNVLFTIKPQIEQVQAPRELSISKYLTNPGSLINLK